MIKKYRLISVVLLIAMIFSVFGVDSDLVRAADLSFRNIYLDPEGVLTWDPENMDRESYHAEVDEESVTDWQILKDEGKLDVRDYLKARRKPEGTYDVKLEADDKEGNHYLWTGKYTLISKKIKVPDVSNIRWEGDYIVWDFDASKAPEGTIFVVDICMMENGISQSHSIGRSYDHRIYAKGSAVSGTHDYRIFVTAQYDDFDYKYSNRVKKDLYGIAAEPAYLTGLKYEDGILSWDAVPGAADYDVTIRTSVDWGIYKFEYPKTNRLNIAELYGNQPQTLEISVGANGRSGQNGYWDMTTSAGLTIDYDFQGYALSVFGKRLDLNSDLNDVLGDGGSVKYIPEENRLILKDLTNDSLANIDRNVFDTEATMFEPGSSLTVEGNADLELAASFIDSDHDLTFASNSSISIKTAMNYSVWADNLWFQGGEYTFKSEKAPVIAAYRSITLTDGTKKLVVDSTAPSGGIMRCGYKVPEGKITIPDSMKIYLPENGRLTDDHRRIVDKDGNRAGKIHISVPELSPAPTATPVAKPTVKPTAKPTVKPTVKPTDKPAVNPTGKPVTKPTTAPSVTSASKPQAITPKPTEVPAEKKTKILSFVERLYSCVLGREPEKGGAAFWSDELYGFRRTGAEVGLQFIFSDEFVNRNLSDEDFVTVLYNTFFDREPEEGGFEFWTSALSDGTLDRAAVANGFIYSQEWADTCAAYGIRSGGEVAPSVEIAPADATYAFVERMYTTAMNRESDAEGAKFWANELSNFRFTGEQVGVMFFLSDEMKGFGLSNDEFVTRLYKTFMDRDPEEGGFKFWVGYLDDGGSREGTVLGFTRSEEFVNKCIEARILPY